MESSQFTRTEKLLGKEAFCQLQQKNITIVGLGAVGSYVLEAMARAGIGAMRLVDFDRVETSNINRQLLAFHHTVGQSKTALAAERVYQINPCCKTEIMDTFCNDETINQILNPAPDLLIDAIDALNPKTSLLQQASCQQIPVISSMGAALRTDPAQIKSGDLFSSTGCPLARHLRRRLRRRGVTEKIACVYSTEKMDIDFTEQPPQEVEGLGRARNILGSLPTIPGIFGLIIANMAILYLTGQKETPQDSLRHLRE